MTTKRRPKTKRKTGTRRRSRTTVRALPEGWAAAPRANPAPLLQPEPDEHIHASTGLVEAMANVGQGVETAEYAAFCGAGWRFDSFVWAIGDAPVESVDCPQCLIAMDAARDGVLLERAALVLTRRVADL